MKTKTSSSPFAFLALLFAVLLAAFFFCVLTSPAYAQTVPDDSIFVAPSALTTPAPVVTVVPAPPWYLSTECFAAVFSLIAGGVAIWQNKKTTAAEKVSASLIVAMEAASKIPQVAAYEKEIKAKLNEKLTKSGAQPVVERLLKGLT